MIRMRVPPHTNLIVLETFALFVRGARPQGQEGHALIALETDAMDEDA